MQLDTIEFKQHLTSTGGGLDADYSYYILRVKVSEDEFDDFLSRQNGAVVRETTITEAGYDFFDLLPLSSWGMVANKPKIAFKYADGEESFSRVIDYANSLGLYNTRHYTPIGTGSNFQTTFTDYLSINGVDVMVGSGNFSMSGANITEPILSFYRLSNRSYNGQGNIDIPFVVVSDTRVVIFDFDIYCGTTAGTTFVSLGKTSVSTSATLVDAFNSVESAIVSTDPYEEGGESGTGGGTGTFTDNGDPIDFPGLPSLSAVDTGFITLFNPSLSQLQNLANYMWSNLFDLDGWKKIFADPMDAILGLSIVPVAVPDGGNRTVTVGNISTGVTMTMAASQYVAVDCGTLNVEEYWGAYLDYDPYTKCSIYLPYIGTHAISVDDVMGKPVHIKYHIDILSGACTAFVKCGQSVMYEFIGQCTSSIPITGNNWTNVINGVLGIAGSVGTMIATGGLSAPVMGGGAAAAIGTDLGFSPNVTPRGVASMAQDVMAMKPQIEKSGAMSGTGGMLAIQTPYMILERPRQAIPRYQNDFLGYPSFIYSKLGDLDGYTEMEEVHLEAIPCMGAERQEIENFLKGGVIL